MTTPASFVVGVGVVQRVSAAAATGGIDGLIDAVNVLAGPALRVGLAAALTLGPPTLADGTRLVPDHPVVARLLAALDAGRPVGQLVSELADHDARVALAELAGARARLVATQVTARETAALN